jgi:hypothetical protein
MHTASSFVISVSLNGIALRYLYFHACVGAHPSDFVYEAYPDASPFGPTYNPSGSLAYSVARKSQLMACLNLFVFSCHREPCAARCGDLEV